MGTTYSASWNAWISSSAGVEWNVARVPPPLPLLPWWPPDYWLTNCRLALTGSTPYHPPNSWFTWTIRQGTAQSYMSILAFFLTYLTLSTSNSWLILKLKIEICLIKSNILVTPERCCTFCCIQERRWETIRHVWKVSTPQLGWSSLCKYLQYHVGRTGPSHHLSVCPTGL